MTRVRMKDLPPHVRKQIKAKQLEDVEKFPRRALSQKANNRSLSGITSKVRVKHLFIELPWERPESNNKSHAGQHWAKRKREVDRIHELVLQAIPGWEYAPMAPVEITVTAFCSKDELDAANVAGKLYEDGLVKAGVLPDDAPRYVREMALRSRIDEENPRVEIEIVEV